jgi:hypothetical protein
MNTMNILSINGPVEENLKITEFSNRLIHEAKNE